MRGRNVADKLGDNMYDKKLDIIFPTNAHTLIQSGLNTRSVTARKRVIDLGLASE